MSPPCIAEQYNSNVISYDYFGLPKLYKMPTTQIACWTSVCLLYKTKNMCVLCKKGSFLSKNVRILTRASSCHAPSYPWLNMSTCHTPIRSTLWPKCSIHIHDERCQPVDMSHTHKVNTLTKMFSTYPWFNMSTCHTPIRLTLWPKCSIHNPGTTFFKITGLH